MQNARSTTGSSVRKGTKRTKTPKNDRSDPFSVPPHPLGYRSLSEERPLRASRFGAVLPSVVAKYGLGRKIGVDRFLSAWRESLAAVFGVDPSDSFADFDADDAPSKLATYSQYARPVSFRGGVLRVEIASNLLFQELQFYLDSLLRELRARLPDEKIDKIKLTVRH